MGQDKTRIGEMKIDNQQLPPTINNKDRVGRPCPWLNFKPTNFYFLEKM
jgi:hypothetical protein